MSFYERKSPEEIRAIIEGFKKNCAEMFGKAPADFDIEMEVGTILRRKMTEFVEETFGDLSIPNLRAIMDLVAQRQEVDLEAARVNRLMAVKMGVAPKWFARRGEMEQFEKELSDATACAEVAHPDGNMGAPDFRDEQIDAAIAFVEDLQKAHEEGQGKIASIGPAGTVENLKDLAEAAGKEFDKQSRSVFKRIPVDPNFEPPHIQVPMDASNTANPRKRGRPKKSK